MSPRPSFLPLSLYLPFLLLSLPLLIRAQSPTDVLNLRDVLTPPLNGEPFCLRYCLLSCLSDIPTPFCNDYRQGCTTNECLCGSTTRMKIAFEKIQDCVKFKCENPVADGEAARIHLVEYCRAVGYQLDALLSTTPTSTRPTPTTSTAIFDIPPTTISSTTPTASPSKTGNPDTSLGNIETFGVVLGVLSLVATVVGSWVAWRAYKSKSSSS